MGACEVAGRGVIISMLLFAIYIYYWIVIMIMMNEWRMDRRSLYLYAHHEFMNLTDSPPTGQQT